MSETACQIRVRYTGEVQGVGFRYTVRGIAQRMGVAGVVENLPDGTVHLVAEASASVLKALLLQIRTSRLGSHIEDAHIQWEDAQGLTGFDYR